MRAVVRAIDRSRAVTRVTTLDERLSALLAPRRFLLSVVVGFSLLAFGLALVGVHAVVSQTVTRRTREFETRTVLGARSSDVLGLVLR